MMPIVRILSKTIQYIKGIHLSNNIISYFICIAIASIVWLLNTLNKNYSTEFICPIKYINFPEDKYSISELPSQLHLEVQAKGFTLLSHKLQTSFLPITVNLNSYDPLFKANNGLFEYSLHTNFIKDKINSQMDADIKLLNIYPENIDFKFAPAKQKKVAIRPHIDYTLKQQYILTQIKTTPDSILVSGPSTCIDTLQYISTIPIELKKLHKNTSFQLDLGTQPNLSLQTTSIKVELEIEQYTETKRTCPIIVTNAPDSLNIRLFPSQVQISYAVGLSQYDQIKDQDFVFSVEFPKNSETTYLEVKATKIPSCIQNLSYSPKKIEYILEKK